MCSPQHSELNRLANTFLTNPKDHFSQKRLQELLGLDELNFYYFCSLLRKANSETGPAPLVIADDHAGKDNSSAARTAYPTAIAPESLLDHLPYIDYESRLLPNPEYHETAKTTAVWLMKMQAGTGSSMTRASYVAKIRGISPENVKIGAKGTDLFVRTDSPDGDKKCHAVSLAEAQILQAVQDAREGRFKSVIFQDLVGPETQKAVAELWQTSSLPEPGKTYDEWIASLAPLARRAGLSYQSFLPTLTEDSRELCFSRVAPGGHALFALHALRAAYVEGLRPHSTSPLIGVIGNGEDLSSSPDSAMVGWMIREKIPIAMITTEKTPNDLKGGQIALVSEKNKDSPEIYITIIERAQAEASGQTELFEKIGLDLRLEGRSAFFNTNVALFNYEVLEPFLKKAVQEHGEETLLSILAPDPILNTKKQLDSDGVTRKYIQLEGAMGSSLLNLDRFWRKQYGQPLVSFINVGKTSRTRFFSPIKSAFDFFMQFHSDLFDLDTTAMRLNHRKPGYLPSVVLKDEQSRDAFYQDVQNVLDCFKGTSIIELESLRVDGQVRIKNAVFRGKVIIQNHLGKAFDLDSYFDKNPAFPSDASGRVVLDNIGISIHSEKDIRYFKPA